VAQDVVVATKNGSSIGIAFVEFKRYEDAEHMMALDRKYFGQRYVEVSLSTLEDQQRLTGAV
jgi:RNA recognition motif-containing protein